MKIKLRVWLWAHSSHDLHLLNQLRQDAYAQLRQEFQALEPFYEDQSLRHKTGQPGFSRHIARNHLVNSGLPGFSPRFDPGTTLRCRLSFL